MVLDYYKLDEQPFGVTPDPRYLFLSSTHREALASIQYGVSAGRGFTALIAGPGMGKTSLLFDFLVKVGDSARTVFLFQSISTPKELLRGLLDELGIPDDGGDLSDLQRKLNVCLTQESAKGRQILVVIDEAQRFDEELFEVVRMLSNFENSRQKLLHIILAGQPALAEMLASQQLVQLRQRISIVARLNPFDADDTQLYIDHRLRVAGYKSKAPLFTKRALAMIVEHSGGIPRNINNFCFNAMSLGCALKVKQIDASVIEEVLSDLDLKSLVEKPAEISKPTPQPVLLQDSSRAANSSFLRNWWAKGALSAAMLLALGGIVTLANRHSARLPDSQASATPLQAASLSPATSVTTTETTISESPNYSEVSEARPVDESKEIPTPPVLLQVSPPAKGAAQAETFVIVQRDQTIFRICIDAYGKYNPALLERIRELNPELDHLDRLKIGQKIRLPALERPSSAVRVIAVQEHSMPVVGASNP